MENRDIEKMIKLVLIHIEAAALACYNATYKCCTWLFD